MKASMDAKLIMVVSLTAAQVLHETLDELQYTSYYRQQLKNTCIAFERELTKTCDHHIEDLYGDFDKARAVHEGIEQIATTMATMKPSEIVALGKLMKSGKIQYIENGNEREIEVAE